MEEEAKAFAPDNGKKALKQDMETEKEQAAPLEAENAQVPDDAPEETVDEDAVADASAEDEAAETEDAAEEETEKPSGETAKKDGLFKKKKKSKEQEKIEELTDQVKRQMAEFDNFRKRTEKEKAQMFETGAKSIIEKILPIVDNFERGIEALSEEERAAPFAEGMEKVYKQLIAALEEAGVTAIDAEGKEFDPNFHNAVMHIEDESLGENIVAQVLQKGYLYHDAVVRHSMVQVAN